MIPIVYNAYTSAANCYKFIILTDFANYFPLPPKVLSNSVGGAVAPRNAIQAVWPPLL